MVLGGVAIVLHVRWYTVDKGQGAEIVSGFGAVLVVLGVFVGSRPYIRAGVGGLVSAALPRPPIVPIGGGFPKMMVEQIRAERPRVVLDVLAERVIAVAVVVAGTLLNGYGPLVARMLHLRGP